jgi:ribosomal protein S12 methylthiotransferase
MVYPSQDNKIGVLSLGCPRNLVDSESVLGRLSLKGYSVVDIDKADVALLNTCAFVEDAKKESIDAILGLIALKKKGKLKKIIVHGCLVQRYKDKLIKEFPEIDAFVGRISLNHQVKSFPLTLRHYAYLKICEGCVNSCSYCVIPKIKSKFVSLNIEDVLRKVKKLEEQGISELNIIGQDISGYGIDIYNGLKLDELLEKITLIAGNIGWIRLLYLYPSLSRISDKLLKIINRDIRICKYVDLPIQHINGRILKLMNRNTGRDEILRLIEKIRRNISGVGIRTSLIVGFPSETEREFKELVKFIEEVKFERMGAFTYSREEGTPAYRLKGQIPKKIKQERFNIIMASQQKISQESNSKFLGKTLEVLIDSKDKDFYLGRSQYDAPEVDGMVYVKSERILKPGEFVKVKISDTLEYDLVGEALK